MSMQKFIPISQPSISEKEISYVNDAVSSGWVSSLGKYIDQFEEGFAKYCGVKYAIAVSNGTVAIHLALVALNIKEGDEVIVPDLTFIATANAVLYSGATPVFADIDPVNLCISPESVKNKITSRTRAIIPVHLYGHPADMDAINKIAEEYGLYVIEDAAEAHGAEIQGVKVGGLSFCSTFSFYGNKIITTGEGGMITTNDKSFYEKCRFLRDHAMDKNKRYWHTAMGFNYRITNLQAALGCAQLERIDDFIVKRKQIFDWYTKYLEGFQGISLNRHYPWAKPVYWLVCLEVENFSEQKREEFIVSLKKQGVDSRPYFYPVSGMPMFEKANTPIVHDVYQKGINLPTYFDLGEEDVQSICSILKKTLS
jgi:perosamine synthetase